MSIQSHSYNKVKDFNPIMRFPTELYEKTNSYENWFSMCFKNDRDYKKDGIRI